MTELIRVIEDYLEQSSYLIDQLKKTTGKSDLMRAWRSGQLEKSGQIDELIYEFHGVGIYIEKNGYGVEIDFLPEGKVGGFDSWRLWQFVKKSPEKYQGLESQETISRALDAEQEDGSIAKVASTNLYQLSRYREP
jgi:hypothetical protein